MYTLAVTPKRVVHGVSVATMAIVLAVVAGCGGGGGEDNSPIQMTFTPSSTTQAYDQQWDPHYLKGSSPEAIAVHADFSRAPPTVPLVRIRAVEPVFGTDPIPFGPVANDPSGLHYVAELMPNGQLQAGVHEGDAYLDLCQDDQCVHTVALTGNAFHYKITVAASLHVVLAQDGVVVTNPGGAEPGTVSTLMTVPTASGSVAVFTSNMPVTWYVGGFGAWTPMCTSPDTTITQSDATSTTLTVIVDNQGAGACELTIGALPGSVQATQDNWSAGFQLVVAPAP